MQNDINTDTDILTEWRQGGEIREGSGDKEEIIKGTKIFLRRHTYKVVEEDA